MLLCNEQREANKNCVHFYFKAKSADEIEKFLRCREPKKMWEGGGEYIKANRSYFSLTQYFRIDKWKNVLLHELKVLLPIICIEYLMQIFYFFSSFASAHIIPIEHIGARWKAKGKKTWKTVNEVGANALS